MTHASLIHAVRGALERPLPGPPAQSLLAPRPRRGWPADADLSNPRIAAGLLMLVPVADVTHLILTERSSRVRHAGQLSLPGGVVERGETYTEAAIREAREEIALDGAGIDVLGELTPIDIPVSGFRLHPVVASFKERPVMQPSDIEVARILEIPIRGLLANAGYEERQMQRGRMDIVAPGFAVHDGFIWGATAMVLAELLVMLGWHGPHAQRS